MASRNITQTQIELPRGCTTDIHICGQCKSHFTSISTFIDHKQKGCSSTDSTPPDATLASLFQHEAPAAKQGRRKSRDVHVPSNTAPADNVSRPAASVDVERSASQTMEDVASLPSVSPSPQNKVRNIASQQSTPLQQSAPLTEKRYKCSNEGCDFTTRHLKNMQRHIRIHTAERPYKCTYCYKRFTRQDKLKIHERIHSGDKPFQCNQCSYRCVDGGSLKKHMRIHNDERPFKCQICNYRSRNSSQLVVHLRTHTGDTPFHCQLCDSKFKINSDLTRHMRTHSGEKPYKCTQCDYKSSLKSNLGQHMRTNHGTDKKYQCEECGFACCTKRQMKQHSHSHTTTKPIKCLECSFQCYNKVVFKRHERKHSDERPYKCQYWDFDSKYPGHVPTHVKKRHPETIKKRPNRKIKSKVPPTGSGPDATLQVVSKKPFQCDVCTANFMRQDSLLSHKRQHDRMSRANSRESMDRESTAYAIYQLQYSGGTATPETQSTPYGESDKPTGVLNTLLSAIDTDSISQTNGTSVQQQCTQQVSSTDTISDSGVADIATTGTSTTAGQSAINVTPDVVEVEFPADAMSEVEVTSDNPPDGSRRIDEGQNPVMIVHSNANIDPNTQTITVELVEQEDQIMLAEVQSSSEQAASNSQTSAEISSDPPASSDHSYPDINQRNTTYIQIIDPETMPRVTARATETDSSPVAIRAATSNASQYSIKPSSATATQQQLININLHSQLINQHVLSAQQQQGGSVQLVTSNPSGFQRSTNPTPVSIAVGQPVTVPHPSTLLIRQQVSQHWLTPSGSTPVTYTVQNGKPAPSLQSQSARSNQQQQTLIVQPSQQQISVPMSLYTDPQQRLHQQQVCVPVQETGAMQRVTFPQASVTMSTASASTAAATAVQQRQQPNQSSTPASGSADSKEQSRMI